jgi:Fe-S cluster biogenesis protein NfuA
VLLRDLENATDPPAFARVEELVGAVVDLYGAALGRLVEFASEEEAGGLLERMAGDELIASLMHLHGLHPDSLPVRVEKGLEKVRPLLAQHGGGDELLDVDEKASAVLLRLEGSCSGCPSSVVTLRQAVERAVLEEAPEVVIIDVEQEEPQGVTTPVEIRPKPRYRECPSEVMS